MRAYTLGFLFGTFTAATFAAESLPMGWRFFVATLICLIGQFTCAQFATSK